MKEYLIKINGVYKLCNLLAEDVTDEHVKVPNGAEAYGRICAINTFYKDGFSKFANDNNSFEWEDCSQWAMRRKHKILWQRETLNDQVASAETARQADKVLKEILEGGQDNVNQPSHYCSHPSGIECIEITRHHDFAIGNAIKYLWRAGLKDSANEIQDLEKAAWYIQDKINQLKK